MKHYLPACFKIAIIFSGFILLQLKGFSQPAKCTAAIGFPPNGLEHHLNTFWDSVPGATSYQIDYSTDNVTWHTLKTTPDDHYDHNAGNTGNVPVYYRVSSYIGSTQSAYTYCSQFPIYTACDYPELPHVTISGADSLTLQLVPESPTPNAAITTYAVYCTTTDQYLQTDGTLGSSSVWQTIAAWGTVGLTGLGGINYCFYTQAKNHDGDVRPDTGSGATTTETFTTNANFDVSGASPTNKFWSPSQCTTGGMQYFSTGGCEGGYIGFTGAHNNYYGCFLRSPSWNCSGDTSVVMTFDLSNSYIASHEQTSLSSSDRIRLYMWGITPANHGGTYMGASSIKIYGVEQGESDYNGESLRFDVARTCVPVSVTFNLDTITNLTNVLFYIEADCEYNDAYTFSVGIDNVTLPRQATMACPDSNSCSASVIRLNPANRSVCALNNASFSVSAAGTVNGQQWQLSPDGGNSWNALADTGFYTGSATDTLNIATAIPEMSGNRYRCILSDTCGDTYASSTAILTVKDIPYTVSVILNVDTFSVSLDNDTLTVNGPYSFQWYYNGNPVAFANSSTFIADSLFIVNNYGNYSGSYFVQITDSSGCIFLSDTFNVSISGIKDLQETKVQVFPNPLPGGNWQLIVGNDLVGSTAEVADAEGRQVWRSEIRNERSEIPAGIAPGIYILNINAHGKAVTVKKLIKLNP